MAKPLNPKIADTYAGVRGCRPLCLERGLDRIGKNLRAEHDVLVATCSRSSDG